jgi:hypothetical protein
MANSGQGEGANIGGAWNGLYFYRGYPEPVSYVALLIDVGTRFSGSIREFEGVISEKRILLHATVDGRRNGSSVSFLKTYDGTSGWKHSVGRHAQRRCNGDRRAVVCRWCERPLHHEGRRRNRGSGAAESLEPVQVD